VHIVGAVYTLKIATSVLEACMMSGRVGPRRQLGGRKWPRVHVYRWLCCRKSRMSVSIAGMMSEHVARFRYRAL